MPSKSIFTGGFAAALGLGFLLVVAGLVVAGLVVAGFVVAYAEGILDVLAQRQREYASLPIGREIEFRCC